ncbi:phosphoglycolate phosphatase-like HAD superfamily hydrolase [Ruminiclostridium sufflavum DSM 19573]|uniref:Phosphoglycolate phosphatase-like HAD superfamily hydrolase n=1 Tax=Ruminiclostridium sufflavum DSM 19573 TaxID=1121337 RepID=A0A318XNL5_9FIRM|nr:HAD family hydrolase [Ruminiclostridium sufflavum]PYG87169.1 phosphoglycolate phosphatase-like HAD superfamily hydrolase [Ruminiclostridium sufflavum DSM 19573]
MSKTAYIDFDGTVVDVMHRYHGILAEYLHVNAFLNLSFEKYCLYKRQGFKDHIIVDKIFEGFKIDIEHYVDYKRINLESNKWLKVDTVIGSPQRAYKQLNEAGFKIYLLTQRNYKERLINQVKLLNLEDSFDEYIVLMPLLGQNAKAEFLKNKVNSGDIIIGDSPIEIECANMFDIAGFFVETGLWGKQFANCKVQVFENYNAVVDFLTSNI